MKLPIAFIIILLFLQIKMFAQPVEQELINMIEQYRGENNLQQAAASLNKLAFYYWENVKLEKAVEAFEQSIALNIEIGNENAVKAIYSNLGMIYTDMGQPETSLVFFRKSLLISRNLKSKQDVGTNLINISVALKTLNRYNEAIKNLEEALSVVTELKDKRLLKTCYGELAELYEKTGDSQKSMEYFSLYASFQKDIQKEEIEKEKKENKKEIVQMEQKTQKAIKEKEKTEEQLTETKESLKQKEMIIVENEMRMKIQDLAIKTQEAELKNKRLLIAIFIIFSVFLTILALFILRGYRQKKKHNKALEQRNEEIKQKNLKINQSINYAKNIQGAILPEEGLLARMFPESFVFFSPRDVVSGDFYWYSQLTVNGENLKIVAAVDCTGHGVPGAFMSMLGVSFLQEIVEEKKIVEPVRILEEMHSMISLALKQEQSGNSDGMDMVICVYNENKKTLAFAGAVNPLIYIQNNELNIAKGDFFGIGGQMKGNKRMFSQQIIPIEEETICYIFSDGFPDQFGGEEGRKFFSKNFRKLLHEIHNKPMVEQHDILKKTLESWHGEKYQRVDDVLVIGFKIK